LPPPGIRGGSGKTASVSSVPRVEQEQPRPLQADADGHDPAARVERHGRAVALQERLNTPHVPAERPRALVHVGLVRVDVQVRAPVRRHERVPRRVGRLDGLLRRGRVEKTGSEPASGPRGRRRRRGERGRRRDGGQFADTLQSI